MRASVTAPLKADGKAYIHVSGLTNGRSYSVSLRAQYVQTILGVVLTVPGQASAATSATPRTTANAPRISSISTSNHSISLYFDAPTNNGGATITNYAFSFGGSQWIAVTPKTTGSPIRITGLIAGRTYFVRLRAINAAGAGLASGVSAIVVKP